MRYLAVVALLVCACADDSVEPAADSGIPDAGDSGVVEPIDAGDVDAFVFVEVERDRTLFSLDENEVISVCIEFREEFDELVPADERLRFNCTVGGIVAAGFDDSIDTDEKLQAACAPIRDMCIAQGTMNDMFVCPIEHWNDCPLTVAEVETCFVAESMATVEYFQTITCDEATLDQVSGENLGNVPTPEECVSVFESCPNLR